MGTAMGTAMGTGTSLTALPSPPAADGGHRTGKRVPAVPTAPSIPEPRGWPQLRVLAGLVWGLVGALGGSALLLGLALLGHRHWRRDSGNPVPKYPVPKYPIPICPRPSLPCAQNTPKPLFPPPDTPVSPCPMYPQSQGPGLAHVQLCAPPNTHCPPRNEHLHEHTALLGGGPQEAAATPHADGEQHILGGAAGGTGPPQALSRAPVCHQPWGGGEKHTPGSAFLQEIPPKKLFCSILPPRSVSPVQRPQHPPASGAPPGAPSVSRRMWVGGGGQQAPGAPPVSGKSLCGLVASFRAGTQHARPAPPLYGPPRGGSIIVLPVPCG